MMDLLRKRRSIRKYTGEPVSAPARAALIESLLRSPTSRDAKSSEFILVDDPDLLAILSAARVQGGTFLKDAPLAIVVVGNTAKSDVWVEDGSIAAITAQLVATSLGLGSCWVQIRNRPHDAQLSAEAFVQKVLGLPEHLRVVAIVAVGHPAESKPTVPQSELHHDRIRHNRYGEPR